MITDTIQESKDADTQTVQLNDIMMELVRNGKNGAQKFYYYIPGPVPFSFLNMASKKFPEETIHLKDRTLMAGHSTEGKQRNLLYS